MGEIVTRPFFKHYRSPASRMVLRYKKGQVVDQGKGLSFWFRSGNTSIAEIPIVLRSVTFGFPGRSSDHQPVSAIGSIDFQFNNFVAVSEQFDFTLNTSGEWAEDPLSSIDATLQEIAQQAGIAELSAHPVAELLVGGPKLLSEAVTNAFNEDVLATLGIQIANVRVTEVNPDTQVRESLQAPTREKIMSDADEAVAQRRAAAVKRERALQENELQNKIDLAAQEENLIAQQASNNRLDQEAKLERDKRAQEAEIEAQRANTELNVFRTEQTSTAEAAAKLRDGEALAKITELKHNVDVAAERNRIAIYAEIDADVLLALALKSLAENLPSIESLTITPDLITNALVGLGGGNGDGNGGGLLRRMRAPAQ